MTAHEQALQPAQLKFGDGAQIVCDGLVRIFKVADIEAVALQGLDLLVDPAEMLRSSAHPAAASPRSSTFSADSTSSRPGVPSSPATTWGG